MKNWKSLILLSIILLLSGCKAQNTGQDSDDVMKQDENTQAVTESNKVNDNETKENDSEENETEENKSEKNESEDNETYTWNEMTVTIPASWKGKYTIQEHDNGFCILQTACNNKQEGWGYLCGFFKAEGYINTPNLSTIYAYTDKVVYYNELTDSGCLYGDDTITKEYEEMSHNVNFVTESLKIEAENVQYNADEFILYNSDKWDIQDYPLETLDINQLWIARNEIFARYGRKFTSQFLQDYFNQCSWYVASIEPDDFDENMLNETEKNNLNRIKSLEERYEKKNPYPQKYKIGESFEEDLNADGKKEKITFRFEKINLDGDYTGLLTIDGKTYDLVKDYDAYFLNPNTDGIYVTDISRDKPGLEIAVMDYGPSDDPVTEFYSYSDTLTSIGVVEGFPFKEYNGINGFVRDGAVIGLCRADLIYTCYVYGLWWFDHKLGKLDLQNSGMKVMQFSEARDHELYEDLSIYTAPFEDSIKVTLMAQKHVTFLETDGEQWIKVRGRDGVEGYIRCFDEHIDGTKHTPNEVFSNLPLYD